MSLAAMTSLLLAGLTLGQTSTRLTPEEARDGWIQLFDGETPVGWTAKGEVKVADGKLTFPASGKGDLIWKFTPPPSFQLGFESRGLFTFQVDKKGTVLETIYQSPDKDWKTHVFEHDVRNGGLTRFSFRGVNDAELRTIKLRPLGGTPLFNGKDLAGWKLFAGKKSKVEVKDGALTLEDGPGDLQTEGKYKNFLLQLECKVNGKRLNSGVFFRCRPGEYQNGYEAQINNHFSPEEKEYAVDEYDPMTHQLTEKKKVKSTAVDYGTGAIYRRMPTTKNVAKDNEWFTMTVLAQGNHIATWVNGVPTVDWHDHRPPSDNARNGYRREGGHISLQGHDPATNLSFRNIRIVDLGE